MKDARTGLASKAAASPQDESVGLWRALEEDARAAVLIGKSEGRPIDPESVAQALMHVYRRLPQASALTQKLRARVAEMIATRGARAS